MRGFHTGPTVSHRAGERHDAGLAARGGVVRGAVEAADRGDHRYAAGDAALDEAPRGGLADEEMVVQVALQIVVPGREVVVEQRRPGGESDDVDDRFEPAEGGMGSVDDS